MNNKTEKNDIIDINSNKLHSQNEEGFIIYASHEYIKNKSYIYLFGRLKNSESFLLINEFKTYFYITKKDFTDAGKIIDFNNELFDYEETNLKTFSEEEVIKIYFQNPRDFSLIKRNLEDKNIICYEADIKYPYRFLIDNNIRSTINISGEYTIDKNKKRVYNNPKIKHGDNKKIELKIISIDIETNIEGSEIYAISFYSKDYKKVLIKSNKKLKNAESYNSEKEILEAFLKEISEYDPDIIIGWNVIEFDFKILYERFKYHKISFIIGRNEKEAKMRIYNDFMKASIIDIPGRVVLDGLNLLRQSNIELEDYRLNTVAKEILGDEKIKISENMDKRHNVIEKLLFNNPEKLAEYNLHDSYLVYEILDKKGIIDLTIEKSLITGLTPDKVKGSIAALDMLYISEAKKRDYVCPSARFDGREERVKGGYVMDSQPGIYDYIIVCDFKSLYPSIIRTFNIDPLTFSKDGLITAPNNAKFKDKDGILQKIIPELFKRREEAKKEKNLAKSYAIKIIMNSFYGVLANPTCRFYNLDIANAITSFAREIVKETTEEIRKLGYEVIYGDTDSVFIKTNAKNIEDVKQIGNKIQNNIDEFYKNKVRNKYNRESFLNLEFEKIYKKFLMPKIRGLESGAKKRYAGLLIKDNKEEIDIVGLEFVRRDWTELAKNFQMKLLKLLFSNKDLEDYIRETIKNLNSGKLDNELVYRKAIRKELEEYTKTTPPHVKAARKLEKLDSAIIEYVITTDGPEPIEQQNHPIDYNHYLEKQLKPIAESILVFFNKNLDDVIHNSKQKSIFDF
jgi:DNA polymerase II